MHIPEGPVYDKIRTARILIASDYISIVLLNVIGLVFMPIGEMMPLFFITTGMFQSLFLAHALLTLINPAKIKWKGVIIQAIGVVFLFMLNLACRIYTPEKSNHLLFFTIIIYILHLSYHSYSFFHIYERTLSRIKDYFAEEEETRFTWVKKNFVALLILSVSAVLSIINKNHFYYTFIVCYVIIYAYIAIEFINRNHKFSKVLPTVVEIANKERKMEEDRLLKEESFKTSQGVNHYNDQSRIAFSLDLWITEKGYLEPDVTIDKILNILDTTRPTLRAFMHQVYGMTFSEWRNELRLEYAYNLIHDHPEYTIYIIAKRVGFSDEENFEKAFRKKYSLTPHAAKKNMEK